MVLPLLSLGIRQVFRSGPRNSGEKTSLCRSRGELGGCSSDFSGAGGGTKTSFPSSQEHSWLRSPQSGPPPRAGQSPP